MNKRQRGFTLIEIMVAIFVLVIGLAGILILFPKGIEQTKVAVEETQAALVAQSAYNALRNSVKQMSNTTLVFTHDGMDRTITYDISAIADGESIGIPGYTTPIPAPDTQSPPANAGKTAPVATTAYSAPPIDNDFANYCRIGRGAGGNFDFNVDYSASNFNQDENEKLKQYSFNIQISKVATNPSGLYDVAIHVRRGVGRQGELVRSFYTQITIPD